MMYSRKSRVLRSGFTLVELAGVLIILVLVAAMVIPLVGGAGGGVSVTIDGVEKSAEEVVTETTMQTIRDAILGTSSKSGAWTDLGQRTDTFPQSPDLLLGDLMDAQQFNASIESFNPITKIGWRGPYLSPGTPLIDAWGSSFQIRLDYDSDTVISEAELRYVVLISPGPNGVRDFLQDPISPTNENEWKELTLTGLEPQDETLVMSEPRGDDVLLFLRTTDPQQQ